MKKGLAVLLALVLTLSLAGCGKKNDTDAPGDDDAIPETPIKLETLHVEFVKGERDVDDLLALKDTLPLDVALLPLTACFDHEDTITLALVQDADDGTTIEDREAIAVTKKNKTVATDGFRAALRGAVEALCADEEGSAALSRYEAAPDYRAAEMSDFASERAAYEKESPGAIN